jgi:hypothetical protein
MCNNDRALSQNREAVSEKNSVTRSPDAGGSITKRSGHLPIFDLIAFSSLAQPIVTSKGRAFDR